MPPSKRWIDDSGSAALEFITAGMLLLIPIVYLILVLASLQAGSLAVEGAARQAARVFVQAPSVAVGEADARRAVEFALGDAGLHAEDGAMTIGCVPRPSDCLSRGGYVTVSVSTAVGLPLVPPALALRVPLEVRLSAASTEQVSRFRSGS